jgi:CheY-like chemotaxis protein
MRIRQQVVLYNGYYCLLSVASALVRSATRRNMPRILVIDDDPANCMVIRLHLKQRGHEVTIADGASTGLEALAQTPFDLMIVDIFMPGMRGFESVRVFHERAPAIPLIAISGYAFAATHSPTPDFLRMTLELGATRCLRKPFKPAELAAVVEECLAEAEDVGGACAATDSMVLQNGK